MPKTKAYTRKIDPTGSNNQFESNSVNESSPTWILTFISWDVRDTLRAVDSSGINKTLLQVRKPLVVENDCIQVSTNVNKSVLTHSMSATLVETDINYVTAVAPGDFVFVNMLNWGKDAKRVADNARNGNRINGINDGFKGVFKVQGVRKLITVDPETGTKRVLFKINGFAFTEFNNTIYFNPYILNANAGSDKDKLLFSSNLLHDYAQLVNVQTNPTCQDIIQGLIKLFVGRGVDDRGISNVNGVPVTANTHFYMPSWVGSLLGIPNVTAAKDVYSYLFGIQDYSSSQHQSLAKGMNPASVGASIDRFYLTAKKCQGQTLFDAEYWNQIKAWSIINQYVNSPLNELYTCFRISPEGSVMPTIVYRQTPFTSELFGQDPFASNASVTRFLSLPRWKINYSLTLSSDLGRDESARINFVQIYAQPPDITKKVSYLSAQTAAKNYAYDVNDVVRSGLRPSVTTTAFQDLTITQSDLIARDWALIVGDAMIGGHLKFNGTLECAGIVDPIAVGDNLEYDSIVYHIEEVMNTCSITIETGKKLFRTILKLSCGVSIADATSGLSYAEMAHISGYQDRKNNFQNGNKILPGVSEEQDVGGRPNGVAPTKQDIERKSRPFAQPGQVIKPIKDEDSDG